MTGKFLVYVRQPIVLLILIPAVVLLLIVRFILVVHPFVNKSNAITPSELITQIQNGNPAARSQMKELASDNWPEYASVIHTMLTHPGRRVRAIACEIIADRHENNAVAAIFLVRY